MSELPSHSQIYLPLLDCLQDGARRPLDVYSKIAVAMGIPEAVARQVQTLSNGRKLNPFERRVRWARQDLVRSGHISKERHGLWELTDRGEDHLCNAKPGVVLTVFETEAGQALWATAETASAVIRQDEIQSIITSPPYPIIKGRQYGTFETKELIDLIVSLCGQWKSLLKGDGSLVLNLGDCFVKGEPTLNLYQERILLRLHDELGYKMAQRFVWYNPSKPPSTRWTTQDKVRVVNRTEQIYWLSLGGNPKANPEMLRRPYSQSFASQLARGVVRNKPRPSGHGTCKNGFARDNGGALPDNLLNLAHSAGQDSYNKDCRERGLDVHPARMPYKLTEFFIKLTTDEGDTVYDPMAGSLMVPQACENLNRRWIANERSLNYLCGASLRGAFRSDG
jgi:site-specific DNA-methyltransferase (cytosine-N4-specific)